MSVRAIIGRLRNRHTRRRVLGRLQERNTVVVGEPVRVFWSLVSAVAKSEISIGDYVICRGTISCQKEGARFSIGKRSFVGSGSTLVSTELVTVGDDILIAHDCYITDTDGHSLSPEIRRMDIPNRWKNFRDWSVVNSSPVLIENDAWVGPRVTILKGVTIGECAVVCAGSVVTRNVAPMTVAAGVPAREVKKLDQ